MRAVGLAQLALQVRQRLDLGGQGAVFGTVTYDNITDAELTTNIQSSLCECYEQLIQRFGDNYYYSTYIFNPVQGQQTYQLPFDFLKILGVDVALDSSLQNWLTVKPFNIHERNLYSYAIAAVYQAVGWTNLRYQLQGQNLAFIPAQGPLPGTCRVLYIPQAPILVATLPVAWAANTTYQVGQQVTYTVNAISQVFTCLVTGTSAGSAPSFNVPGTTADSSALVWIYTAPADAVATSFDGVNGWEELIVIDAAIKCAIKQEHSCTELFSQKQAMLARMDVAAANRQAGDADAITGGWGQQESSGPFGGPFGGGFGDLGGGW